MSFKERCGVKASVTHTLHSPFKVYGWPDQGLKQFKFGVKYTGRAMTEPRPDSNTTIISTFLTLQEAAELLRFSTRTLRDYVQRGEIRGKLIGNRWRFRRADIDAFFDAAPSEWEFDGK
jgi:excisionase family DNA binding protein